jgi:hypothetical protein
VKQPSAANKATNGLIINKSDDICRMLTGTSIWWLIQSYCWFYATPTDKAETSSTGRCQIRNPWSNRTPLHNTPTKPGNPASRASPPRLPRLGPSTLRPRNPSPPPPWTAPPPRASASAAARPRRQRTTALHLNLSARPRRLRSRNPNTFVFFL